MRLNSPITPKAVNASPSIFARLSAELAFATLWFDPDLDYFRCHWSPSFYERFGWMPLYVSSSLAATCTADFRLAIPFRIRLQAFYPCHEQTKCFGDKTLLSRHAPTDGRFIPFRLECELARSRGRERLMNSISAAPFLGLAVGNRHLPLPTLLSPTQE